MIGPAGPRNGLTRRAIAFAASTIALPGRVRAGEPTRVACLEWTAAESTIALGVQPIAVSDVGGYGDWTVAPVLPAGALDLGSRFEPNLERLTELRPDLIVMSRGYGVSPEDLARIAPMHEYVPFPVDRTALASARAETQRLAERLGRPEAAAEAARRTEETISAAGERLRGRDVGPICVVSLFDDRNVRFYGKGGLFQDVMDRLGVRNGWPYETNRWGFSVAGIDRLSGLAPDVRLVRLDPIPPHIRARLDQSSLWRAAPAVRSERVTSILAVWPFGGLEAAARFATLLADRLGAT